MVRANHAGAGRALIGSIFQDTKASGFRFPRRELI